MLRTMLRLLTCVLLIASGITSAQAQQSVLGTWTGTLTQNTGESGYSVVMTLSPNGGVTDYPELKCSGKLKRVGSGNGAVFFTETITRGGHDTGGQCFNGTLTVIRAGDRLVWGWVGTFNNETYVVWGRLTRK
jgi:hypothetical protein